MQACCFNIPSNLSEFCSYFCQFEEIVNALVPIGEVNCSEFWWFETAQYAHCTLHLPASRLKEPASDDWIEPQAAAWPWYAPWHHGMAWYGMVWYAPWHHLNLDRQQICSLPPSQSWGWSALQDKIQQVVFHQRSTPWNTISQRVNSFH